MLKRIYDWVLNWADNRYGVVALSIVSFLESSIFPIPPDPLLIALCLGKPSRAFWFALICSVMSVLGGISGYLIGLVIWEAVSNFFFSYVFSENAFLFVNDKYHQNAFIAILGAALTPIPYKVFTITAGVFKVNFFIFLIASAIGRPLRFFTEAALISIFGQKIKLFIDRYFNILAILFFILLLLGFFVIKYFFKN